MSIVRIGLAETQGFADGYDAIFGGKKKPAAGEELTAKQKPIAKKKSAMKKAKKK